ncbi:MAG: hypothetical protein LBH10_06150 [Burkholderiaceae bacterium]|jgi:hypothetical protein|nr:hypothetical protein [Burkholderiaceae bacterium]
MTVILASAAFWAPVAYRLIGDGGQAETVEGRARYRRLKTSERRALDRRIRSSRLTPDVRAGIRKQLDEDAARFTARERTEIQADLDAEPITDAEFLAETLLDWDFRDRATGQPIPYSAGMLAQMCEDWDGLEAALVRGYTEAQQAALDAREIEKNSAAPSGTGS